MVGLVSRKRIEWISYNYELSLHAKDRIKERQDLRKGMGELIRNSPLSWSLCQDVLCIALNLYEYIIVATEEGKATITTFVNTKDRGDTVIERLIETHLKGGNNEKPTDNGTNGFGTIRN